MGYDIPMREDFTVANTKQKKRRKHRGLFNTLLALILVLSVSAAVLFVVDGLNADNALSIQHARSEMEYDFVVEEDNLVVTSKDLVDVDAQDLSENQSLETGVKNILLLGTDARLDSGVNGLTDTIMILSVCYDTGSIKLTSIMRDTWVKIPGRTKESKINAANVYGGPLLAMKTVNEAFDLNIDDYVLVNMQGLIAIIDGIGGIELSITEAELEQINYNLDAYRGDLIAGAVAYNEADFVHLEAYGEKVHVNGQQALAYARIRSIDSDYVRTERQRNVITSIAKTVTKSNIFQMANMVAKLFPYVSTSMSIREIVSLGSVAWKVDIEGVEQIRIPVDGTFKQGTFDKVWCIKPDYPENIRLLHEFIYGPETEDGTEG